MIAVTSVCLACFAPAAVLERKIHDIEFFKQRSKITGAEVRSYAKTHKLPFDEERLKTALSFAHISSGTEFSHMVASLRRGEKAYPATIVQRFAQKHRLPVDRDTEHFLNEQAASEKAEYQVQSTNIWATGYLEQMLREAESSTRTRKPHGEKKIREHATKHGLPIDESRLRTIFAK
ncbi:MAG: hypothetical protein DI585_04755 [Pseudomonas fluorescens]|nr:MAG: hypothetical protein DI585_04755 [Pseudomonas fluorescens]